ncbi:aldo/keto reductase [Chitinivibrio alkaliphilus]|uniref:Aldo-keto reductase n=1 Tax=Chitinivibrio alkaliphilus ACht1 TaxID=1313304 RepID=U7D347_9BACT|nr:aldo/keto reductase [Chitinivibrio alkaliphilus]ERP30924.1 Aldo-keto reductase [Chitinivibrio alkaliphilus ACht1]
MQYTQLGSSSLRISSVCLGSMTWGLQNTQEDADSQIEYALSQGITFIDTAEMYAVPPSPETYGKTETIIGNWLKRNREKRSDIVLATKIVGPGLSWVRGGSVLNKESVIAAVDASLARLQTDYIDLYQLHWPRRATPHFGKQWPGKISFSEVDVDAEKAHMHDVLLGIDAVIRTGKVRYVGLSNDTPWGIQSYLELEKEYGLPRIVSVQNEFNLTHAKDWPFLLEQCRHENIAYLPWSPLAGGLLTGKYHRGARPEGARWSLKKDSTPFRDTEAAHRAVAAYGAIAQKYGYTPAQLALAWCASIEGVTAPIIGATTMEQLKEDIDAFKRPLCDEARQEVEEVFQTFPAPY